MNLSMFRLLPAIALVALGCAAAFAQTTATATQTLTLEVRRIASVSVSGDPQPLTITTATAGDAQLQRAEDHSTTYSMTSNSSNMKLAVSLDAPMPEGTRLYVEMASLSGTSRGKVDISQATAPLDAVTGIGTGSASSQQIVYTFEADADRSPFSSQTRTVILTLTD